MTIARLDVLLFVVAALAVTIYYLMNNFDFNERDPMEHVYYLEEIKK